MKALLLLFTGILIGFFYFGHLYLQLQHMKKKHKFPFFFTFLVRFSLLSIVFGMLFYHFGYLAIYTFLGFMISRYYYTYQ
ncbi:ATP synthase subunit I [Sulfurovum sp.]|uniref:N-ATPase subunit AtpR n=1 Tax=Sulfurovum sp. TaxID=1969726 RepID=UPI0039C9D1BF